MPNDRTYRLVVGVHKHTPIPADVLALDLKHRTAIVLDTFRSWIPDMYFDAELFLALLAPIDRYLNSTVSYVLRLYEPERVVACDSLTALHDLYAGNPDDAEIPESATWARGSHITGRGYSERWDLVGGPSLYHDSCTFSVFTHAPLPELVLSQVQSGGQALGAHMTEFARGEHIT